MTKAEAIQLLQLDQEVSILLATCEYAQQYCKESAKPERKKFAETQYFRMLRKVDAYLT